MHTAKPVKNNKIGIVETIRGLAALAVCLYHFRLANIEFIGSTKYYFNAFSYGWLGVEAFFVLSGFIIPYSLIKSGYRISQFFKFFAKRCIRIEPPYLLSIVIVVVLGYAATKVPGYKGEGVNISVGNILSHVGYLPEHLGYKWLLPVYWSLEAEFHYYILIGLLLPFLWKSKWSILIGFAAGLASSFFIPLYVFSFMPLFIMGIATCAKKTGKINDYIYYASLIAAFSVCIIRDQPLVMPGVGLVTALAISYLEFKTIITDFLGKISFSLYLLHVPIGGKMINLLGRHAHNEWQVWGVLLAALTITLFASWVFYKLVEHPSQLLSKRISYKNNKKHIHNITTIPAS